MVDPVQVLKKRNTVDWAEHMQQSLHFELKAIKNPNIKKKSGYKANNTTLTLNQSG